MKMRNERFSQKLHEQVGFLQRSCDAFDLRAEDEALRISTTLRIMFHDTQKSTSLVSHLGFKKKRMVSSARGLNDWHDYLRVQLDLSPEEPVKMLPMLGDRFRELTIDDWWGNETVFCSRYEKIFKTIDCALALRTGTVAHMSTKSWISITNFWRRVNMHLGLKEIWLSTVSHGLNKRSTRGVGRSARRRFDCFHFVRSRNGKFVHRMFLLFAPKVTVRGAAGSIKSLWLTVEKRP